MRRTFPVLLGTVAVATALAGCSSASTGAGATAKARATSAGSAGSPSPADPDAGLKKGTALKGLLPTGNDVPAGFTLNADNVRDTGDVFDPPSTASKPLPASCPDLEVNAWISVTGIGSASFAQTGFRASDGEIDAEIDTFRGSDPALVMARLRQVFAACRTYQTKVSGSTAPVTVAVKPGPTGGDESIRAVLTSPAWDGGQTLVAIRVGNAIVSVLYSSARADLGARASSIAATVATRLRAAG